MKSSGWLEVVAMIWRQIRTIGPFPGMVTVVIPGLILWLIGPGAGFDDLSTAVRAVAIGVGVVLLVLGFGLFVWTVALFARRGKGTLAPFDAPTELVVDGPYRHVRNPMYAGVFAVLAGEVLVFQSWTVLVWFAVFATVVAMFVPRKEERWLMDRFPDEYAAYRSHVPRWIPRPTGWTPEYAGPQRSGT
ncbi:isoprenylcysteine carboxylmethyltransferase family protein [Nocardia sp. NPDC019395]|uniref:methyltransferase family protein n=1 Tax=Nocardia sp. NPDC019395 TaxID=3154686 RepID=UPI0033ED211B